ncbi:Flagellar biosynthesis protein FlhF [Nitrincola lacisaponensis]|uniref:Flagellar biosynthesis protein FlhF n=1 Tax=Nitrincola lacisaponensis TaxID=267850 RepID=A0A063Y362_9GAMM|nr:flagellar biosynthesis protein FlhF [Nitrincola lacisaponensis]KDE39590.1 Flagellar biosynthesis protein FlhF [Nitrincola lacisaponensis]
MKVKRIFAPDMRQAMRRVRDEIGADAVIISNHRVAGGVEVVAAREEDYERAQAELKRSQQKIRPVAAPASVPAEDALAAELRRAKLRIAEARRRAEQPEAEVSQAVNRQIDTEEDEDLRFILQSLKTRQDEQTRRDQVAESVEPENLWATVPAAEASENDASGALVQSMQQEIHQLRALMEQQLNRLSAVPEVPVASSVSPAAPLQQRLQGLGLGSGLIRQLTASLESELSESAAWKNVLSRLADSVPVIGEEYIARGGMIAFVGATGVGKTTTIGKLAARYVLQHGSSGLALVTTDCYRIAAHEQLKTFGRILDVPVRVVDENHNLDEVLMSLRGKRLVLIDTAGMNASDPEGIQQKQMLASVSVRLKKLLVLSCSSQRQLIEKAWSNYQELELNACVLTKLDESGSLGDALTLAVEKRLPIAYIADGQKIPDDLIVAQRQDLVSRAVVAAQSDSAESDPLSSGQFFRAG